MLARALSKREQALETFPSPISDWGYALGNARLIVKLLADIEERRSWKGMASCITARIAALKLRPP
jgi:hypothetical protein